MGFRIDSKIIFGAPAATRSGARERLTAIAPRSSPDPEVWECPSAIALEQFRPTPSPRRADQSALGYSARRTRRKVGILSLLILPLILALTVAVLPVRGAPLRLVLRAGHPLERLLTLKGMTWSDFAPAGWVTVIPTMSSVVASSTHGFDPATADYAISTDAGGTWSAWLVSGLSVTGAVSSTQTLAVTNLTFPDAPSANLIRFRIAEIGGALQLSPNYTLRVDTTQPVSVVTQPIDGAALKVVPAIAGTADDGAGSGVSRVETSLRRHTDDRYWSGTGWVLEEQWLTATGTAAWNYATTPPAWADGTGYTVRSRATDTAGNAEVPHAGSSFVFDTTPPVITLTAPNGGEVWTGGQSYTITWTATDAVGLPPEPITLSVSYDAGATWATLAVNLPNTGSYPWTPPLADTNRAMMQIEVIDRAGNRGVDRSNAVFTLDSTLPGAPLNLTANPDTWTNVDGFTVSWTNPVDVSPVAGAWYKLDAPPSGPSDGVYVAGTAITHIPDIAPATDGAHPIYVWLQDAVGRADHSKAATTTLYRDQTPPPPPFGLAGNPARRWTNANSFTETWTNPLDLSGIAGAYYRFDSEGAYPTDGILVSTSNRITDIIVPEDGKHDLYLWLVDTAGNVSHLNRNIDPQVFWYDGTPPSSAVVLTPPLPASGWYSATVTAAFQGLDPVGGSGLDAVRHRIDGSLWSTEPLAQLTTEGQHEINFYAQDLAGNWEPVRQVLLALDLTPPAVSLIPGRPPQANGWYTAPVTLTLTVADALSGNPRAYYRLNGGAWQSDRQIRITADGVYQIEYFGEDAAGNRTAIGTSQVKLDSTPPSTAYLVEANQGQNGWFTSSLTVKLIATDNAAGVAATYYQINTGAWQTGSQFQLSNDGLYTILFYSTDAAGNTETGFPVQLKLDSAAPGAPTAVETTPNGWSRVNRFSVQWANPTDLSGLAGVYYRLDSAPTGNTDGTFSPLTNRLDGLTVPSEGVHPIYLWLRDNAGNADYRNRTQAPSLRYDATPPTTTATLQGPAGSNGWYRGPVTVTLTSVDGASGLAFVRYRLNAGPWIVTTAPTTSLLISSADKHIVEFAAQDVAGNAEPTREQTIRIDSTPPPAAIRLSAGPSGWQHYNSFDLLWTAPADQSGIAGAYVKFNAPPTGPTDGTFHPAAEALHGLEVPGEGVHDVYVWLRDLAGNSNQATAVALPKSMWYDGTPPRTEVDRAGTLGQNGWFVGPITFTMTATDATSGLDSIRYQVDDGPWHNGDHFTFADEGVHVVRISSTDIAGNTEPAQVFEIRLDSLPPIAQLGSLARYQGKPSFAVSWQGYDPALGSGLTTYEVQVRDGYAAAWQTWFAHTTQTSATFSGERGHTYFFRVAARDLAGNRQPFTAGETRAMVETVLNGGFDTGNFADWQTSGLLFKAVVPTAGPSGANILAARLGSEEYGPSIIDPGAVPVGDASILQVVQVPDSSQMLHPTLSFWYRVQTYDVMHSKVCQNGVCDTFDVTVDDGSAETLLLRDGNPTTKYRELYDTGWKWAKLDLTPFAGQTVQLKFANWNRHDNKFNTWTYMDDVRLIEWPLYGTYLSSIMNGTSGGAAWFSGSEMPQVAPTTALGDEIAETDDER